MAIFTGEYDCKMDTKGRLVLPSRMKSAMPSPATDDGSIEVMLRRGFEPCIILYPIAEFKKLYSRIVGLNEFNEENRTLQRNFFRANVQVELDSMGRFLVPKPMIRHAQLEKEVVVAGVGNRIEIWQPELYDQFLMSDQKEFSALAQKYLDN